MGLGERNQAGLDKHQIKTCVDFWVYIGGPDYCALDTRFAHISGSKTKFEPNSNRVILGSDAYPGKGPDTRDARAKMPVYCCLAHEFAHVERYHRGIDRPFEMPDYLLEEAEASIHASFVESLSTKQRKLLIEDARDQLEQWLEDVAE